MDALLPELTRSLRNEGAAVLVAETGAGKTTRVPPALLAQGVIGQGQVVMLEPRRLAARAAAQRMAEELECELGGAVGYQVRFDRRASEHTRILVVTEGILLRKLQEDPFLDGVEALIFDEFHGRSLTQDLVFAMARQVQREVREDLKLLAMSATLDAAPVADFLGGAPIHRSAGRTYPVDIQYRPSGGVGDGLRLEERVAKAVSEALEACSGSVLAFLPGVGEIRRTADILSPRLIRQGLAVQQLFGDLPLDQQREVLRPGSRRRVVLATNVAESSVTVAGVEAVVDCGLEKRLRQDPAVGLERLETGRIDRASADQRSGRAGRQGPGVAYRLWSEHEHRGLAATQEAEIHRLDLSSALLQLSLWGEGDGDEFRWYEPPPPASLRRSRQLLLDLGALQLESGGRSVLTPIGRKLAALPVAPRLGRLLVEMARLGHGESGARVAALLSERSPFSRLAPGTPAPPHTDCDLADREEWLAAGDLRSGSTPFGDLHRGAAHHVRRVTQQLSSLAQRTLKKAKAGGLEQPRADDARTSPLPLNPPLEARLALRRALLATYPDRLARRRPGDPERAVMVGGRGLRLAAECAVRRGELFVAVHAAAGRRGAQGELWVRSASAVEAEWLEEAPFSRWLEESVEVEIEAESGRVVATRRRRFRGLVLEEARQPASAAQAAAALASAAAADLQRALPREDEAFEGFLARLRWLAAERPELELPTFDERQLAALLPALAAGCRSFADLRKAPWLDVLRGSLSHRQLDALEREAPERLQVPSGSRIRLRYEEEGPPILAARIQELFGLAQTPRLAAGRVPVLLHLLAPNHRPQQVTRDLASFWANTYPEVRKELAGRYPKHAWPVDPLSASPERRPRRRGPRRG